VIEQRSDRAVLRVRLLTGRKHQIRAQLAERGWPIVGDRVYGKDFGETQLKLRAVYLEFDHPRSGKRIVFETNALS
jgi:23S rRNA-/tRNA-specific pseudouridylate synthase